MCLTFSKMEGSLWRGLGKQALPVHLHGGGMLLSLVMLAPKELGTGLSQTTQGLAAMLVLHHTFVLLKQPTADRTTPRELREHNLPHFILSLISE